ncbi:MAG: hypothetical protein GF364_08360 [Candidatus Lokiarchaeota archaeon]|nr:hypothetical protein [Candidatus Lokiarchaeota archaeon]
MLITCIGDSLTAGHSGPLNEPTPETYQYWLREYLVEHLRSVNHQSIFFNNFGVGGAVSYRIYQQLDLVDKTDWIIIMGGTNDFWFFSSLSDEEQNQECINDVLKNLENTILSCKKKDIKKIVICSIPPVLVGESANLKMHENILKANKRIQKLASNQQIIFCDIHLAMRNKKLQMKSKNCMLDGVHFSVDGNRACGYAIGKTILANI